MAILRFENRAGQNNMYQTEIEDSSRCAERD